jgi:tellurite resistance protein
MSEHDALRERGRALEEDYFRRKDRELIEKMRRATAEGEARAELGRRLHLTDASLLQELQDLGFTWETASLLALVPLIETAWAQGGVSQTERHLIVQLARARGVAEGDAAHRQLEEWLTTRPDPTLFTGAARLVRAMLEKDVRVVTGNWTADELVKHCEEVAAASGGVLGFIGRVSAEEREVLARVAAELYARQAP